MKKIIRSFVGMDVHKATISISVAEDGRGGTVRFIGVIPNTPEAVGKMAKQLARHGELDFCYEANGCGYGVHRQLTSLGHKCIVVASSLIPRKSGERIKTDRRDSEKLAILQRSGDLTPVWAPDPTHEALRDLVRARVDASMHLMRARQQLLSFLLRHGRSYTTGNHWTQRHRCWLAGQTFQEQAHGTFADDLAEDIAADNENEQRSAEEVLLSTIDATADDKLTSFALRLALAGHVSIPREGEFDFLTEAETAFVPPPPTKKAAAKKAKQPTSIESPAKAIRKAKVQQASATKKKIAA